MSVGGQKLRKGVTGSGGGEAKEKSVSGWVTNEESNDSGRVKA